MALLTRSLFGFVLVLALLAHGLPRPDNAATIFLEHPSPIGIADRFTFSPSAKGIAVATCGNSEADNMLRPLHQFMLTNAPPRQLPFFSAVETTSNAQGYRIDSEPFAGLFFPRGLPLHDRFVMAPVVKRHEPADLYTSHIGIGRDPPPRFSVPS